MADEIVRIHIDRQPYDSPTPTSAAALYALGHVSQHRDLFREVGGDDEDPLVERDAATVEIGRASCRERVSPYV